jgi:anti-sigma factor RsiW
MRDSHLTDEQIGWLVDGRLDPPEAEAARAHAGECEVCRHALDLAEQFEECVRSLPLGHADAGFTDRVMGMLPHRLYKPMSPRLLVYLAPAFGSLLVLSAIGVAFFLSARSAPEGEAPWVGVFSDALHRAGLSFGTVAQDVMEGIIRFAPFLRDRSVLAVSVFSLAAVAFLATLDKFVVRKLVGRS